MFINLDIGTSSVKGTLIDDSGKISYKSSQKYSLKGLEENYRELDVDEIWSAVEKVIRHLSQNNKTSLVRGIIVTSLGEAIVLVDQKGNPLMRSIVGSDPRGVDEFKWLCERINPEEISNIT